MVVKRVAVNFALLMVSTAASIIFINIIYIVLIRQPYQSRGFPRHLIPDLPHPSRWLYADTGSKGNSRDIALLGDSYLEAIGDDFSDGLYNYSLAHFLHQKTGLQISQYGTGGSYLPRQLAMYQKALRGGYWPLHDSLNSRSVPTRIILFFYEGNNLNDYISRANSLSDNLSVELPFALRYFPIARLVSRRWDRVVEKFKFKFDHFLNHLNHEQLASRTPLSALGSAPVQTVVSKPPDDPSRNGLEKSSVTKGDSLCGPHFCLPAGQSLQGPALELTTDDRARAIQATVASIIQYARQNPARHVCLVYMPSPSVIYAPFISHDQSSEYSKNHAPNPTHYSRVSVATMTSQNIRRDMFKQLKSAGIQYVDTTPNLVEAAKSKYLHGRQDVNHFNRHGYKVVVESLVASGFKCLT